MQFVPSKKKKKNSSLIICQRRKVNRPGEHKIVLFDFSIGNPKEQNCFFPKFSHPDRKLKISRTAQEGFPFYSYFTAIPFMPFIIDKQKLFHVNVICAFQNSCFSKHVVHNEGNTNEKKSFLIFFYQKLILTLGKFPGPVIESINHKGSNLLKESNGDVFFF